jgi:hypothetical protein
MTFDIFQIAKRVFRRSIANQPMTDTKRLSMTNTKFQRDESIKLGDVVRDRISGFEGTIVAITEWLNGCRRITIQPSSLFEGKPVDSHTFDAEQIVKVSTGPELSETRKGGPSISPQRHRDPK